MEKIIITCSAKHLSYEFPNRKWYQRKKQDRIALMRLASVWEDVLDLDMLLRIDERFEEEQDFFCKVNPIYKKEIYHAMLQKYKSEQGHMEHVILLDNGGDILTDFLYELAENKNYLSILTMRPQAYETVLEQIAMDFGLFGMVFSKQKELIRYLKQLPYGKKAIVIAGEDGEADSDNFKLIWTRNSKGSLLYHLPDGSFFMDFSKNEFYRNIIFQKRMEFTYVSIPIFLDNTVKNRYNAVVNEGITFQVINKKTVWRRKGNQDGRKEEYSDL